MKLSILNVLTILLLISCTPAMAYDAVFVLSKRQSQEETGAQVKAVLQYLTRQQAGYEALFIDGSEIKTLGAYKNPEKSAYSSPKARLKINGKAVKSLMDFANATSTVWLDKNDEDYGSLNIPQALRLAAENRKDNDAVDIILIGSPLYLTSSDYNFSMKEGRIPSDGHLNVSRAVSPYGTADQPDLLQNMRVHFLVPEKFIHKESRYRFYLERFWTLYVEKLGGTLISFTHDWPSIINALEKNTAPKPHAYELDPTPKLEMIYFMSGARHSSIFDRKLDTIFQRGADITNARKVMIGIKWDCMCDIDLYARPFKGAPILSFYNSKTPQGRHYKEHVISDKAELAFEIITFDVPVDLTKLEILINYFGGQTRSPVKGEIRLAVNGEVYAREFYIEGKEGYSTEGILESFESRKAANRYIRLFDPVEITTKPDEWF